MTVATSTTEIEVTLSESGPDGLRPLRVHRGARLRRSTAHAPSLLQQYVQLGSEVRRPPDLQSGAKALPGSANTALVSLEDGFHR